MTTNLDALSWRRIALANSTVDFRDGQWEAIDQLGKQRYRTTERGRVVLAAIMRRHVPLKEDAHRAKSARDF